MCGAKITRAAWAAACENRHSTRPHETLAEVQIAPRRHLQSHPPWVMANFKTVIRAHCVLYCAEVCSPAQFCFCLLVAVVFVHPPLDVSPIVSLQQWLIERDANERNEHRGLFFFFVIFKELLGPFLQTWLLCFLLQVFAFADVFLVFPTCCLALMHYPPFKGCVWIPPFLKPSWVPVIF